MTTSARTDRAPSGSTYFSATRSLCPTCKGQTDAKILFEADQVFLQGYCPSHGRHRSMMSSSVAWYLDALSFVAPSTPPQGELRPVQHGCPHDCGPCRSHQQKVYLPVIPITSACNLDCPICYTVNKNTDPHMLSRESFAAILAHLRAQHDELDIINFTGGEPTMHPDLPHLLKMARDAGIRRLTLSTNGLRLLDEAYVKELAALDVRVVLSLDTLHDDVDQVMLGARTVAAKLKVLDLLDKHGITTTLLPAVAAGLNDRDVGPLLNLVLTRANICSLEMHTLTFTGQGGAAFDRSARITVPDLHRLVTEATGGSVTPVDFVPSPLAHPHCYSICYLLMLDGGAYVPFTRFMGRARFFDLLSDSLYVQPREKVESILRDAMDELWAAGDTVPNGPAILRALKRLLTDMFPERGTLTLRARQRIAERATKAIDIHSHMDEETFDVSRIMRCSVGVPETDGSNIPTCAYNILYRERDSRFSDDATRSAMKTRNRLAVLR